MELVTPGVRCTATGLVLPKRLSFEQWHAVGQTLFEISRAWQWWVGDWINYGERRYGETYVQAIEVTGKEYDTLRSAAYVAHQIESVRRRTNLSWSHHRTVAALPAAEQDKWLATAEEERLSCTSLRRRLQDVRTETTVAALPLPRGKYNLILADPPWRYDNDCPSNNRQIERHYPTMALDHICGLNVSQLAAADCVLFLWATSPKLAEALTVVPAWGFTYRTCMVWRKDKIGMGFYARQQHELLLIGTKGRPGLPPTSSRPSSVVDATRRGHSVKPVAFYEIIDAMYPHAKKVELFARTARRGWRAWGDEVESNDGR